MHPDLFSVPASDTDLGPGRAALFRLGSVLASIGIHLAALFLPLGMPAHDETRFPPVLILSLVSGAEPETTGEGYSHAEAPRSLEAGPIPGGGGHKASMTSPTADDSTTNPTCPSVEPLPATSLPAGKPETMKEAPRRQDSHRDIAPKKTPPRPAHASRGPGPVQDAPPVPSGADAASPEPLPGAVTGPHLPAGGAGGGQPGSLNATGRDAPVVASLGAPDGPSILSLVRPAYPIQARRLRKEGRVVLRLLIDASGIVRQVILEQGAGYGFDEAAMQAANSSRFRPARREGRPVACYVRLPVVFGLQ